MANGPREVRISLNVVIAGTVTIVGALSTGAAGLFAWHAAQREQLENRVTLALQDAVYTLGQRDDRQDIRRTELYRLLSDRMDKVEERTTRMETLVLERALESLIKTRVEEDLPPLVKEELPEALEEALEDAP